MATPGSAAWSYAYWGNPDVSNFRRDNIVTMTFYGVLIPVHKLGVPKFRQLERIFIAHPYGQTIDDVQDDWGYANRCIRGTGPGTGRKCQKSNHSWGTAVDINATRNALGTRGDMPQAVADKAELIGFRWGGHYSRSDPMHFEIIRTPAELAAEREVIQVESQYSPPLALNVVSSLKHAASGGLWILDRTGAVYAFDGAPYGNSGGTGSEGAPNGQSYWGAKTAARIKPGPYGPDSYTVVATTGEEFSYAKK